MANVYDLINNRILSLLEQGTIPWKKTWNAQQGMPRNLVSKREYRGVNLFLLSCSSYGSPYWLTYKQCLDLDGHVKQGQKSTAVIFWKWIEKQEGDESNGVQGKVPVLRYYNLFNAEQCEDIPVPPVADEGEALFSPIELAELVLLGMPMKPEIRYGGNRAYYSPSLDYIQLPERSAFSCSEEFYSTLFHECVHATGHSRRLSRKSILEPSYFGSHEYSKEELVAAFLCGHAGIDNATIDNSAAYIQGWLKALRNDKSLLVHAAAQAQRAADYILNIAAEEREVKA